MKETLSRILGTTPAQADVTKSEVFTALAAEFEAYKVDANAVVETYTTQVGELTAALATAGEQVATLTAALAEANEKLKSEAEKAEELRLAARKEKIVAAIGEAGADALMTATHSMEDAQFEAVLAALGMKSDKEAKSPMFNEVGVTTDPVAAPSTTAESAEMKLLKAKYPQSAQR